MDPRVLEIWEEFHDKLKAYALSKLKNEDDTNDLLQEVFIKIHSNLEKIETSENSKYYLIAIVRNAINDFYRHRQINENEEFLIDKPQESEDRLNEIVANFCVGPLIKKLPEKYKEALLLSDIAGIPQKELAEQLGMSYTGLKSRVQRGRTKLKDLILGCCKFENDKYGNLVDVGSDCSGC